MRQDKIQIRELGRDWVGGASAAWSDLLRDSDANPVFTSWAWISSWLETLGQKAETRIFGLYERDCLVAVLPLFAKRSPATIWGKQLSLVGAGPAGADYGDFMCIRGDEKVAAEAIAAWLTRCDDWTQCEFRDVLPGSLVRLVANLMSAHARVEDLPGSVCPRTSLSHGWDDLLRKQFDRKHRYNIEREIRLAEQKEGLRLVFHETSEAIGRVFPALVRLHNQRKAAQGIRSSFTRPDRLEFHTGVAVKLAEIGAAFIATLESDQEIVSAAYCFRDSKSVYYFQTGVSLSGAAIGGGSKLLYMLIRWAANQGYEWFDFLKGDEVYKQSWATDRVQQRIIRLTRTNTRGQVITSMANSYRRFKHLCDKHTIYGKNRAQL